MIPRSNLTCWYCLHDQHERLRASDDGSLVDAAVFIAARHGASAWSIVHLVSGPPHHGR
jgi:hypothetical protein